MAVNDKYFTPPTSKDTFLAARGFDPKSGARSGGITSPLIVDLAPGAILFRFYQDDRGKYGQWWCSPHELALIIAHFGRGDGAFDVGRTQGKGILQAILAVRHEWGGNSPLHMGSFIVVSATMPFKAYFGEGDHAPDATQTQVQKTAMIIDGAGRQRAARQIFLPHAWDYKADLPCIGGGTGERLLLDAVAAYRGQRLPFE